MDGWIDGNETLHETLAYSRLLVIRLGLAYFLDMRSTVYQYQSQVLILALCHQANSSLGPLKATERQF